MSEAAATAEAAVAAPVETTPEAPKSPAFSHLAKKEAEIVRMREEVKKERESWKSERQRLEQAKKEYDDYLAVKSKDPITAMKKLGFSEADIVNFLAAEEPTVELSQEERLTQAAAQAAQAKIDEYKQQEQDKQVQLQKQMDLKTIQDFKSALGGTIEKNKDKYEYCAYHGPEAEELAYEITLAVVKDSKGTEIITPEEAVELAEKYYEEKEQEMSQLKKRQGSSPTTGSIGNEPVERTREVTAGFPNQPQPNPLVQRSREINSLSNTMASTVSSTRAKVQETRDQLKARLAKRLSGQG